MPLPALYPGESTAASSAPVQMMQAAQAERERKVAEATRKQQLQDAEDQRQTAALKIQQDNSTRIAADDARRQAPGKIGADAIQWDSPDTHGKAWNEIPGYARQHFVDAYGDAAAEAPRIWNESQRAATGDPSIGIPATAGGLPRSAFTVGEDGKPHATYRETEKPATVPADVRSELIRLNAWREGMTPEESGQARDDAYVKNGVIPERYQKQATTMAAQLVHHPILAPFAKQKEAYDTMRSGFEHPESGGFGDMALIEGFQRIVNPGAVVRQQTMNQMLGAAGLAQYGSWGFLKNKVSQGDKLSPDARARLMNLAEQTFSHAKSTASRELIAKQRLARMMGIPNPEAFVNNVLDYVAQTGETGANTPPAATAQQETTDSLFPTIQQWKQNPQSMTPEAVQDMKTRWTAAGGQLQELTNGSVNFTAPVPKSGGSIPTVTGPDDYARVPKGQQYIWNGKTLTKQ